MTAQVTTPSAWRGYAALGAAVAAIAWSSVLIRWAGIPGPASAFYRVAIAAAVLVPWRAWRGATRPLGTRDALIALLGGAFFGLDLALYNTAVMRTAAATAAFLGNNAPVFVGLAAWILFRKPPSRAFWAGLALAVAGGAVMVVSHAGGEGGGDPAGDMMAAAAAAFFAGYLLTAEHVRARIDTLTFNTLAVLGSSALLLVVCLISGTPLAGYSLRTWAALLALGLISQVAAYYALVYALGRLPATITSVGLLTQLPLTAVLAAALLNEPITRSQVVGGLLVLAGVYVVTRPRP